MYCLYTFLKVVSYYDLRVLSMMSFQQKSLDRGVGGVSPIQFYLGFLIFFFKLKPSSGSLKQNFFIVTEDRLWC